MARKTYYSTKKRIMNLRVSENTYALLYKRAVQKKVPVSELVRLGIEKILIEK